MRTFRRVAEALLVTSLLLATFPLSGQAGPPSTVNVAVTDDIYTPSVVELKRGGTVIFDHLGPSHHTATDDSGMQLYDSGAVGPGAPSTVFTYPAAGIYLFTCTLHPRMGGRVQIPVWARPARGGRNRTYVVRWAATPATDGFVYDVQMQRPGGGWQRWHRGITEREATFVPDRGPGRYRFRATMRRWAGGRGLWSAPDSILAG